MREEQLSWDKFPQQFLQCPSFCPITTPFVLQIGTSGHPAFAFSQGYSVTAVTHTKKETDHPPRLSITKLEGNVGGYQAGDSSF